MNHAFGGIALRQSLHLSVPQCQSQQAHTQPAALTLPNRRTGKIDCYMIFLLSIVFIMFLRVQNGKLLFSRCLGGAHNHFSKCLHRAG